MSLCDEIGMRGLCLSRALPGASSLYFLVVLCAQCDTECIIRVVTPPTEFPPMEFVYEAI